MSETRKALFIEGRRNGYGPDQVEGQTCTIAELIEFLQEMADELGDDTKVFLRNDRGYTYGSVSGDSIDKGVYNDDRTRVLNYWDDADDIDLNEEEEEE